MAFRARKVFGSSEKRTPDLNFSGVSFATTQAAHDCEYHTLKIRFSSQFKYMKYYLHHIHHSTDIVQIYTFFFPYLSISCLFSVMMEIFWSERLRISSCM